MASVAVSNTFSASTTIASAQVNTNFNDLVSYINARNAGTTSWDGLLSPSGTLSNTTNQLVLGTTKTTTISATQPSGSLTYTIPDAGGAANFVLDAGNYTIAGTWTLSNALTISPTTNQLVLGATRTVTLSAAQPASSSRTYTFPDMGGNANILSNKVANIDNTILQCGGNQVYPIVQVVSTVFNTTTTTTSSTFTSTVVTASITPKFNTSKIFIMVSGILESDKDTNTAILTLKRGSTQLSTNGFARLSQTTNNSLGSGSLTSPTFIQFYDSPATTSSTTYTVFLKSSDNTNTVAFGGAGASMDSVITLVEIAQ